VDEKRHITLVENFEIEGIQISSKQFFMDWYYYGFPKNLMKTSSSSYSNLWRSVVELDGKYKPLFYGNDYRGRYAASFSTSGLTVEMRSNKDFSEKVREILEGIRVKPLNEKFYRLSFYAGKKMSGWFEEERIGNMEWQDSKEERIGDYYPDSSGTFGNLERIDIYRNVEGDYLWVDRALKNTGIKNLYYSYDREGNLFTEVSKFNEWSLYLLSESGPAIIRRENSDRICTVTIPYLTMGDLWKYVDIIEKLNLFETFP